LAGSRQSYCKNYQAYFFWHTLYVLIKVSWLFLQYGPIAALDVIHIFKTKDISGKTVEVVLLPNLMGTAHWSRRYLGQNFRLAVSLHLSVGYQHLRHRYQISGGLAYRPIAQEWMHIVICNVIKVKVPVLASYMFVFPCCMSIYRLQLGVWTYQWRW